MKEHKSSLEKQLFSELLKSFKETGLLDSRLLEYLVTRESEFQVHIAVAIFKQFKLMFGPLESGNDKLFAIPELARGDCCVSRRESHNIHARIEIVFNGLRLPAYVYHQMTSRMVQLHMGKSADTDFVLRRNGGHVTKELLDITIMHDRENDRVILEAFSSVDHIHMVWEELVNTTDVVYCQTKESWNAVRPVFFIVCSHCLMLKSDQPKRDVKTLSHLSYLPKKPLDVYFSDGSKDLVCGEDSKVPEALMKPCK